jgi:hypothetical protein
MHIFCGQALEQNCELGSVCIICSGRTMVIIMQAGIPISLQMTG